MKKIKLESKLSLNKETIAKLNDNQMNAIKGGDTNTLPATICVQNSCPQPCQQTAWATCGDRTACGC
jgi:natural product precursor